MHQEACRCELCVKLSPIDQAKGSLILRRPRRGRLEGRAEGSPRLHCERSGTEAEGATRTPWKRAARCPATIARYTMTIGRQSMMGCTCHWFCGCFWLCNVAAEVASPTAVCQRFLRRMTSNPWETCVTNSALSGARRADVTGFGVPEHHGSAAISTSTSG
jgi:hypothetical protein